MTVTTSAAAPEQSAVSDFDDYVRFRSAALLRTAYLLTHDAALAEDLLQTSLAKAWFAWSRIEGAPTPYIRKIMVNTYSSWWRRKWSGEVPTEELPETGAHDSAMNHDLWQALGKLPRKQRAVVVLRYYEDLSEAETADVLGIAPGTVESQLSKAISKLRLDPSLIEGAMA